MDNRWRSKVLTDQQSTGKKGYVRPEDIVPILKKLFYDQYPQAKVFSSHPMIQNEDKWALQLSRYLNEDNKARFEVSSGRLWENLLSTMRDASPLPGDDVIRCKPPKTGDPLYKTAAKIEKALFELQTAIDRKADRDLKKRSK